jgi:hypothetical protein
MSLVRAGRSAIVKAPPSVTFGILADYRNGHPRILPRKYFADLVVEQGGIGGGTVIRFRMKSFGTTRQFRAEVSEPVPGQVLVERDVDSGVRTTFTVASRNEGRESEVSIETEWQTRGFRGWLEGLLAPAFLRVVYQEELRNLGMLAERGAGKGDSA